MAILKWTFVEAWKNTWWIGVTNYSNHARVCWCHTVCFTYNSWFWHQRHPYVLNQNLSIFMRFIIFCVSLIRLLLHCVFFKYQDFYTAWIMNPLLCLVVQPQRTPQLAEQNLESTQLLYSWRLYWQQCCRCSCEQPYFWFCFIIVTISFLLSK